MPTLQRSTHQWVEIGRTEERWNSLTKKYDQIPSEQILYEHLQRLNRQLEIVSDSRATVTLLEKKRRVQKMIEHEKWRKV